MFPTLFEYKRVRLNVSFPDLRQCIARARQALRAARESVPLLGDPLRERHVAPGAEESHSLGDGACAIIMSHFAAQTTSCTVAAIQFGYESERTSAE